MTEEGTPFATAAALEAWLAEHHADGGRDLDPVRQEGERDRDAWSTRRRVHEALRYGWIDGQAKRLDDDYYVQRFTPRRARSRWSKINRAKAEALIASGAMQPAGLAEVERAKADGRWDAAYDAPSTATVPDDLRAALDADPKASAFFETLDANNRYAILHRIQDAKKPETRGAPDREVRRDAQPRRDDSPTAPRAVAAHLRVDAALVHRAPAARAVAAAVEEQPAAVAAQLQPREPVRAQEVDRGDRDRPQRAVRMTPGPHPVPVLDRPLADRVGVHGEE